MLKARNRKGQLIGSTNLMIVSTVIVVIISLIFFLLVRSLGYDPKVDVHEEALAKNEAFVSLLAYLSTPVSVNVDGNMQAVKMSDLIRIAGIKNEYNLTLVNETKRIFDAVYSDNYEVKVDGLFSVRQFFERESVYGKARSVRYTTLNYTVSETITIPGNLTVTLYLR